MPKSASYQVRFGHVSAQEAAAGYGQRKQTAKREKEHLSAREKATGLNRGALTLTPTQHEELCELEANNQLFDLEFLAVPGERGDASQKEAAAILAAHGLELDLRDEPTNRWSIRWSRATKNGIQTRLVQW